MNLKLFPKIALVLIALAVLPAAIVGWQTATLNRSHMETTILELHTNLATSLAARVDQHLTVLAQKTSATVRGARGQGFISSESLQAVLDATPEFVSISYVNPMGRELLKSVNGLYPEERALQNIADIPAFMSFLSQKSPRQPKYGFYFVGAEPRLRMIFPVESRDDPRGSFCVIASLSDLWAEVLHEGAGVQSGGREAFMTDENGSMILHSSAPVMLSRALVSAHPIVSEALQGRTVGSKTFKDDQGRRVVGAYAKARSIGWVCVIQQPERSAFWAIYEMRRRAVVIVVISILAAALVAFFFARGLSRPIFALINGARRVAQGRFDEEVRVAAGDEISDLAGTFNEMVRELKRYNELQVDRIIEEKTKTEAVIFSIADGIVLTDEKGGIQLANRSALRIFSLHGENGESALTQAHLDEQDWTGKNLLDLIPDTKTKDALRDVLSNPGSDQVKNVTLVSGPYERHYQISSQLVHTPKTGRTVGVVTVLHDTTYERQMDEMKENFLHSITHDLRNPMTSIVGFVKFLMDGSGGPITDVQKGMLTTMDKASARLLGMINDILDIAKIEAGKLEVELEPVLPARMLEDVAALYRPLAERKNITLTVSVPEGVQKDALVLNADPNMLERVIGNLAANAVKYTYSEGTVSMSLEDFPERVQITVRDNGPGIPPDDVGKVFDKFQQVKGQKKGGTGLGLTITKFFVELHEGKVWVESELGKGSAFTFWIPKGLTAEKLGQRVQT